VRPPLGLRPERVFLYTANIARIREIEVAIGRYMVAGTPVPEEWWDELRTRLAAHNVLAGVSTLKEGLALCSL